MFPERIDFKNVQRDFRKVQRELEMIGLWKENEYLGLIDLYQISTPSLFGTLGFIYDQEISCFEKLLGFKQGAIYIPSYAHIQKYNRGQTLIDTIRHEFAHAWYWIDPKIFRGKWFKETFGGSYGAAWDDTNSSFDDSDNFISDYAKSSPAEDFAETFMTYLRHSGKCSNYKIRKGVYRKLLMVHKLVKLTNKKLGAKR